MSARFVKSVALTTMSCSGSVVVVLSFEPAAASSSPPSPEEPPQRTMTARMTGIARRARCVIPPIPCFEVRMIALSGPSSGVSWPGARFRPGSLVELEGGQEGLGLGGVEDVEDEHLGSRQVPGL